MEKQHLTYFKIENFKRFDSFEMDNLGQFNLIVGDNNIGKTSVLEALTFDEDIDELMYNYFTVLMSRHFFQFDNINTVNAKDILLTQFWPLLFKDIQKDILVAIKYNELSEFRIKFCPFNELPDTLKEKAKSIFVASHGFVAWLF